jgi:hypothetical protein
VILSLAFVLSLHGAASPHSGRVEPAFRTSRQITTCRALPAAARKLAFSLPRDRSRHVRPAVRLQIPAVVPIDLKP